MESTLGDAPEALKRAEKALVQIRKVYGEEHPHVAQSYNNIGIALDSQGKYEEALIYFQKSFNDSDKSAGDGASRCSYKLSQYRIHLGFPRKIRGGFSLLPESFNASDKSAG